MSLLIVPRNLVSDGNSTVTAKAEEIDMPASNLESLQPSVRWRTSTTTSTPWIEVDLGSRPVDWDFVGIVGYDGSPSRNMLRAADDMDSSIWAHTNITLGTQSSVFVKELDRSVKFNTWAATANGGTRARLTLEMPGVGTSGAVSTPFRFEILVRPINVSDLDVRLELRDTPGNGASVDFDTSAATSGNSAATGGWSVESHGVEQLSADVLRCWMTVLSDNDDDLFPTIHLLTNVGGTSIPLGNDMQLGAPFLFLTRTGNGAVAQTLVDETYETSVPEYAVTDHDGSGPLMKVWYGPTAAPSGTQKTSGWRHIALRNQLRDWSRFDSYWRITQLPVAGEEPPVGDRYVRTEFWDNDNENSYLELGNYIVGRAVNLGNYAVAHTLSAIETGGEDEADGGQIYRPQRKVRRSIRFTVHFVDQRTAYDWLYWMQRVRGRSRQILAIAPEYTDPSYTIDRQTHLAAPDNPVWAQERMIYGYIDQLDPMPIHNVNFPHRWQWSFTVVETP